MATEQKAYDPNDPLPNDPLKSVRERMVAESSVGGAATYLRNLSVLQSGLKAMASGVLNPTIQQSIADTINRAGLGSDELGRALAGGALTIPVLEAQSIAGAIAPELTELEAAVGVAKAGISRAPSLSTSLISGAVSGFVATGSPIGAIAGAIGGAFGSSSARKSEKKAQARAKQAAALAAPEHYLETANFLMASAREQTFVEAERAQLSAETAISRSGLRGSGIGTQASIAAAATPAIAALRKAGVGAGTIVRREVETTLGTPIREPSDNLARLVTAGASIAGAVLTPERLAAMKAKKQAREFDPFLPNGGIEQGVFGA